MPPRKAGSLAKGARVRLEGARVGLEGSRVGLEGARVGLEGARRASQVHSLTDPSLLLLHT